MLLLLLPPPERRASSSSPPRAVCGLPSPLDIVGSRSRDLLLKRVVRSKGGLMGSLNAFAAGEAGNGGSEDKTKLPSMDDRSMPCRAIGLLLGREIAAFVVVVVLLLFEYVALLL